MSHLFPIMRSAFVPCQDSESDEGKTPGGGGGGSGGSGGGAGGAFPDPNDLDQDADAAAAAAAASSFGQGLGLESEEVDFPPRRLLGPASDSTAQPTFSASARAGGAADGGGGGGSDGWQEVHPLVARRGLDFLWYLCKNSFRVTHDVLTVGPAGGDGGDGGDGGPGAKGKGKGRKGGGSSGKGKSKLVEAMDVAGEGVGFWRAGVFGVRGVAVGRRFFFVVRTGEIAFCRPCSFGWWMAGQMSILRWICGFVKSFAGASIGFVLSHVKNYGELL